MEPVKEKLKQNSGETMVETLIAILLIAIAMAIFASMVGAAGKLSRENQRKMGVYYDGINEMLQGSGGSAGTVMLIKAPAAPVEVKNALDSIEADLTPEDVPALSGVEGGPAAEAGMGIRYSEVKTEDGTKVIVGYYVSDRS